jgi:hypothetical protein
LVYKEDDKVNFLILIDLVNKLIIHIIILMLLLLEENFELDFVEHVHVVKLMD